MAISPTQNVEADDPQSPWASALNTFMHHKCRKNTFHNIKFERIDFVVHDIRFQNYTVKHHSDTIQHKKYIFTIYKTHVERYKSTI